MARDIDPEEFLPVATELSVVYREMGMPLPESGFPEVITALFVTMSEIANGECHCDGCQRIRVAIGTLENLR